MAYGLKAFRKIQISNIEGTPGTAEVATEVLFGVLSVPYTDLVLHMPDQDRGVLAANYETPFEVSKAIELEMEGELYDRLMVFLGHMAIRGNVTATQPDMANEPNHWLWVFEHSMTAPNTPDQTNGIDTFTIEFGDNVQGYETEHLFIQSLEITGAPNEPVTFSATFTGRRITEVTFTGALTAPTAAYFAFNNAKFYIDTTYALLGTNQITGMLRGFTWTFEPMFTPLFAADGQLYFGGVNEDKKAVELELTYYRDDTNSEAEKDKWEAQSMTYLRIELLSHDEMDSGQSNPAYILLDGAYRYTEWDAPDDEDGTAVVTVTAQSFYDVTKGNQMTVSVGTPMSAFA